MAYGPVQILFNVDFTVRENEIVALLGTNGAGKSTLLKGICGLVKPTAGTVQFAGEDVTSLTADVTTHRGISLMPGGKGVFPTLQRHGEPAPRGVDDSRRSGTGRGGASKKCRRCSRSSSVAKASWPATCRAASSRCSPSVPR